MYREGGGAATAGPMHTLTRGAVQSEVQHGAFARSTPDRYSRTFKPRTPSVGISAGTVCGEAVSYSSGGTMSELNAVSFSMSSSSNHTPCTNPLVLTDPGGRSRGHASSSEVERKAA